MTTLPDIRLVVVHSVTGHWSCWLNLIQQVIIRITSKIAFQIPCQGSGPVANTWNFQNLRNLEFRNLQQDWRGIGHMYLYKSIFISRRDRALAIRPSLSQSWWRTNFFISMSPDFMYVYSPKGGHPTVKTNFFNLLWSPWLSSISVLSCSLFLAPACIMHFVGWGCLVCAENTTKTNSAERSRFLWSKWLVSTIPSRNMDRSV